ncbi:hypothetical protein SCUCBS95973_004792 [Sporothrix curviconia]|uniref:Uncharacterized protein n=1 Tax=Sporothrix curviconia TaxID=1260050 RepID=A0ABP0BRR0_9PEZI
MLTILDHYDLLAQMAPPLSPFDSFVDATYGTVTKCPFHSHLRLCFLAEMDCVIANDKLRFQHSMQVMREDICLRSNQQLFNEFYDDALPVNAHSHVHEHVLYPRFRLIVAHFIAARCSIPMTPDDNGLPILRPPTQHTAPLDCIENMRMVMNECDRLYLSSEESKIRARSAYDVMQASMDYVTALLNLSDKAVGAERATLNRGIVSALEAEHKIIHLVRPILDEYYNDRAKCAEVLDLAVSHTDKLLRVVDANENALDSDILMTVATVSHLRFYRASIMWASYRSSKPVEVFPSPNPSQVAPTATEKAAWTYEGVKSEAIRKFVLYRREMNEIKQDTASLGRHLTVDFGIYPVADEITGHVSFTIDKEEYEDVLDEDEE